MKLILDQMHAHYKELTAKQAAAIMKAPDQHLDRMLFMHVKLMAHSMLSCCEFSIFVES